MTQWTLDEVYRSYRPALAVWLALDAIRRERARGRVVRVTREQLATRSGVGRLPSITKALGVLERAGWINRTVESTYRSGRVASRLVRVFVSPRANPTLTNTTCSPTGLSSANTTCKHSSYEESTEKPVVGAVVGERGNPAATLPPPDGLARSAARGAEDGGAR